MITNRQWLESLTDRQLSEFLTFGLMVTSAQYAGDCTYFMNISQVACRYSQSTSGIETWLSMPQDYKVVGGTE